MRKGPFASLVLVLGIASLARAQTCQCPVALLAYEITGQAARLTMPFLLSDGTTLVTIPSPPPTPLGPPVPFAVTFGTPPVAMNFLGEQGKPRYTMEKPLGTVIGECFDITAIGFHRPPNPTSVTDAFGTDLIRVNRPNFICQPSAPGSKPLICFKEDNLACTAGTCLAPNTDRAEDVCAPPM